MENKEEIAALDVLLHYGVGSLPVIPLDICKKAGIDVYKDSDARILTGSQIGLAFYQGGRFRVVIDYTDILTRRRFTLAHELGHIMLGHLITDTSKGRIFDISKPNISTPDIEKQAEHTPKTRKRKKPEIERQADAFAAKLLAPACILMGLNIHTPQEIAVFCNISMASAKIVARDLNKRYKNDDFLINDYEVKLYENFKPWIDKAMDILGRKTYQYVEKR